jgi:hypothetical protein
MRVFTCDNCGNRAHFDNVACTHCGAELGFLWPERSLTTLAAAGERSWRCANATVAGCNWLVFVPGTLCPSCVLTRTRPADDDPVGLDELRDAETAKRWLLFELGELGLPIDDLRFELLSSEREQVTTGHAQGVITLDLAESKAAHREAVREQLHERYRTVLGHLRHEVGHYYQPLLVPPDSEAAVHCRQLFGDERADYQAALTRHYQDGPPDDWTKRYVSAYATMHPMEDWAETFAHVLHIRDTMQTANAHGLAAADLGAPLRELIVAWLPLTIALNELARSMGERDLYPFVLSGPAIEKLTFVDECIRAGVGG